MYTILDKNNEKHYFQKINYHGLNYLSEGLKRNILVYKGKMLYLSGIYIPRKDYWCKYIDINRFIEYNDVSNIVDCTDFMVENKYQTIIKTDKYKSRNFYLKSNLNGQTFEVDYYHLILMMYNYYLMYQVDKKERYKKNYEKIDKYLTEKYWSNESEE